MDTIKKYSKAIAGFWAALAVFAGSVLALGISFPSGVVAVLSVIAASGVVAGVVAGSPANVLTPKQLAKQAPNLGAAVAGATVNAAGDAVSDFLLRKADGMAQPDRGTVIGIAAEVPRVVKDAAHDVVGQVLGRFNDRVGQVRDRFGR